MIHVMMPILQMMKQSLSEVYNFLQITAICLTPKPL